MVFVAGAIPGDRVRAVVHKRKRSYAHARTLEVLEPSPERIAPIADHPGRALAGASRTSASSRSSARRSTRRCGGSAGSRASSWRTSCRRCSRGATATSSSTPSATVAIPPARARVRLSRPRRRQPGGADRGLPAGVRARQPRARGRAALVPRAGAHRVGARSRRGAARRRRAASGRRAAAQAGRGERTGPAPTGARACATWSCAKAGTRASCRSGS